MAVPRDHDESDCEVSERSPLLLSRRAISYETGLEPVKSTELEEDDGRPEISVRRGTAIAISLAVIIFLQATNISMITTTQSSIASDLDAFDSASWFTSAYLIAGSSMLAVAGRLCHIFTPRIYLSFSSIIFAIGPIISGFAPGGLSGFLVGRVVTGCGGGGAFGIIVILVLDLGSKKRRGLLLGLVNLAMTTGVSLGAVIAGGLEPIIGWRALFFAQVPIAAAAGLAVFLAVPKKPASHEDGSTVTQKLARIDFPGLVTLVGSLVLLLLSAAAPKFTIISGVQLIMSAVLFVIFVVIESYFANEPIIPMHVLRSRSTLLTCFASLGLMMARWSVLFYTPVYAIAVRGWSPASAGLILIPTNGGFGLGGLLVGWLHIRKPSSFYKSCLTCFLLLCVSLIILAHFSTPTAPVAVYILATFSNGFVVGALLNYALSHALYLTSPETHYIVTSLISMFRGFAASIGSAVGGGFFTRVLRRSLENQFAQRGLESQEGLIRRLLGSPALVNKLAGVEKEIAVDGYVWALQALFLTASALALAMMMFQAGTGTVPQESLGLVGMKGDVESRGVDAGEESDEERRRREAMDAEVR